MYDQYLDELAERDSSSHKDNKATPTNNNDASTSTPSVDVSPTKDITLYGLLGLNKNARKDTFWGILYRGILIFAFLLFLGILVGLIFAHAFVDLLISPVLSYGSMGVGGIASVITFIIKHRQKISVIINLKKQDYNIWGPISNILLFILIPVFLSGIAYQYIPPAKDYTQAFVLEKVKSIKEQTNGSNKPSDGHIELSINYPPKMTFIINNLDYTINDSLYELTLIAPNAAIDDIDNFLLSLKGSKEANNIKSFDPGIQRDENNFSSRLDDSRKYTFGSEIWHQSLPNEKDLLNIIDEETTYANDCAQSFFTYNRISNHYQKLALEYFHQSSNRNTIKYYYMKSIEYDLLSIEYCQNDTDYYTAKERICTRYNDILVCCGIDKNSDEYILMEKYVRQLK